MQADRTYIDLADPRPGAWVICGGTDGCWGLTLKGMEAGHELWHEKLEGRGRFATADLTLEQSRELGDMGPEGESDQPE